MFVDFDAVTAENPVPEENTNTGSSSTTFLRLFDVVTISLTDTDDTGFATNSAWGPKALVPFEVN